MCIRDSLVTVTAFNYIPYQAKVPVLSILYPDDAQTSHIVNPQAVYNCAGLSVQPKVVIKNMGNNTLSSVQVSCLFDGVPSTINWSGTLNSLASDTVTFPYITLSTGTHSIKVYTSQPNGNTDVHNQNDTVTRNIMVNNLPVSSSFNTATTQYCNAPASVTFANSSQNATSYLWDFGDGTTSTDANPIHNYTNLGVYTVVLTADAGVCGNVVHSEADYITVGATPPAVHDTANCGAASFVLTANGTGTIDWYDVPTSGTPIATGNTYTTPVLSSTTTYYIENSIVAPDVNVGKADSVGGGAMHTNTSYYLLFDCYAPVVLKSVKVYAGAAGNRTIVLKSSGGSVLQTITVAVPAGESRVTLNFNIPVQTGMQLACTSPSNPNMYRSSGGINFPYTYSGLVSITGTNASVPRYYFFYDWEIQGESCISARTPLTAFINSTPPDAGFSSVATGWSVSFTDISVNPSSFKWKFGDGSESTQQNPIHVYSADGTYAVTQIVYNGCGVDSTTQNVSVSTLGIAENNNEINVSIYPNPTNHQSVNIMVSGANRPGEIQILNVLGSQVDVLSSFNHSANGWSCQYNTAELRAGLYYIVIKSGNQRMVRKLVVTE
jgi:PKD repeat protein